MKMLIEFKTRLNCILCVGNLLEYRFLLRRKRSSFVTYNSHF